MSSALPHVAALPCQAHCRVAVPGTLRKRNALLWSSLRVPMSKWSFAAAVEWTRGDHAPGQPGCDLALLRPARQPFNAQHLIETIIPSGTGQGWNGVIFRVASRRFA